MAKKKRNLRLGDDKKAKASRLFNFSSVNEYLFQNKSFRIDRKAGPSASRLYEYYCDELPTDLHKETALKKEDILLPRRSRNCRDPLDDELYHGFHRKMKQGEKSMSVADKSRMLFEVDNLRSQMELLKQHDWVKHLPRITAIEDKTDMEELSFKRKLTIIEITKLLEKYVRWEARNEALQMDMKLFENSAECNDDDSDCSENIVIQPLTQLQEQRVKKRLHKDGSSVRIQLHNGYDIVYGPYQHPKVVLSLN